MNYQLANYLFANETLYVFREKTLKEDTPVDVESEITKKIEKEEIKTKEILQSKDSAKTEVAYFQPKNKVLILVNQLSDLEKGFLGKILGAIGSSFETVDLIELKNTPLPAGGVPHYQTFIEQNVTKKFISFGVGLSKLNWNKVLTLYQTTTIDNIDFLLVDELSKIESNKDLKLALWANLQKLFPKKN